MTVIDNGDGTFSVTTTAEERAAFDQAVASGLIPGGTKALALQGFLLTAFATMQQQARRHMIDEIQSALPAKSTVELQTLLGSVKA